MSNEHERIGISGGTFDPIHYGHLIISEEIRVNFKLDKVIFIPTGKPPHKSQSEVTESEHRFNMVNIAIHTNPSFEVSRIEMEREGYIYTIDTMSRLKAELGESSELFFITGADIVWDLPKWKKPEQLFDLCEMIVAYRPGYLKEDFFSEIEKLKIKYGAKINVAETSIIGISSTEIRNRVRAGNSIKYLVPEDVEKYIHDNNLYR
ncbi:MAG: nicotinate-nucleotide adenylyltransferase [Bacillota bacterium]|nr:nicotinate-nucleotide adenylyltransferase [Bacillota bacterium]